MARAVGTKPRVLLLDEPLAGLAAAERERVGRLIKDISTDLPVLLVEHDIDRVFALADAVTVMNEGEVLVDGTVDDARTSKRVQRAIADAQGDVAHRADAAEGHRDVACLDHEAAVGGPLRLAEVGQGDGAGLALRHRRVVDELRPPA